jgi:ATP-dependent Clp protease ATP-binding subunit ClpA
LRCIGSTTYAEYKAAFERDRALARRFQKIEIGEPTIDETYEILKGLKRFYEDHHSVRYSDESLKVASELAGKYINDRYLPDKAIDVIDEVGAATKLLAEDKRPKQISVQMVETRLRGWRKFRRKPLSPTKKTVLKLCVKI